MRKAAKTVCHLVVWTAIVAVGLAPLLFAVWFANRALEVLR